MKFAVAFAVLFASVAFLGATASHQSEVDEELDVLDLLINPGYANYFGLIQRIRDGLQALLDNIKNRLGLEGGLEGFKQKIDELQQRIGDLVRQGGIKLVHAIHDIRDKLQALLKSVIDKFKPQGYALQGPVGERLSKFVQTQLEILKKRLAEAKTLEQTFAAKLQSHIDDHQKKIEELAEATGRKAIQIYREVRKEIRDTWQMLKAGIAVAEIDLDQVSVYAADQGGVLDRITQVIQDVLERGLEIVKEKLSQSEELFEKFKGKIEELQVKIVELRQKSLDKIIQVAKDIRQKIKDIAQKIVDSLSNKSSFYALAEEDEKEHETIASLLAKRIRDLAQRGLENLKALLQKSKEHFEEFKDKIEELQAKLAELGKQTGIKALETVRAIRKKIQELAGQIADRLAEKNKGYYALADEDMEGGLIRNLVQHIVDMVKDTFNRLQERLTGHEDLIQAFKTKFQEVRDKLSAIVHETGLKALETARALKQKIQDLVKDVLNRLAGRVGYYALTDTDEEDSLITRLINFVKKTVTNAVELAKERLAKNKELFEEFKDRVEEVNEKLKELAKETGTKALEALRALRKKIIDLNIAILRRISGGDKVTYSAVEKEEVDEEEESFIHRIVQRIRGIIEGGLDLIKQRIEKNKEILGEFKEKVDDITQKLAEIAKMKAREALTNIRALHTKITELNAAIIKKLLGKGLYYAAEEVIEEIEEKEGDGEEKEGDGEEKDGDDDEEGPMQGFFTRLAKRIIGFVQLGLEVLKKRAEKTKEVYEEFKDKIEVLQQSLKDLAKKTGKKALQGINKVKDDIEALKKAINKRILEILKGKQEEVASYALYDLRSTLLEIRDIVTTPAGVQLLKGYLERLQSDHPIVNLVKMFVSGTDDAELLVILKEFFKGLNFYSGHHYASLTELFQSIRDEIQSPEGLAKLREYARNLQTSHPIVLRIKAVIETVDDDAIRSFLGELFKGLD